MSRPLTPDMIAERWMCSGETVRQLIRTGKLPAFRIGRMLRVTPQALEEYECKTIELDASMGVTLSPGPMPTANADVFGFRHTRPKKLKAKPAT